MRICILVALAVYAAGMTGCGQEAPRNVITQEEVVAAPQPKPEPEPKPVAKRRATSAQRYALRWTAPDGWTKTPPKPMCIVRFDAGGAECYISILSGAAGGVELNVDRWRRQMGQKPLGAKGVESLTKITVLGTEASLVEVTGVFVSHGESHAGHMLLGVICPLEGDTVFVKMVGPEDKVRAERGNFVSFCESLK